MELVFGDVEEHKAAGWSDGRQVIYLVPVYPFGDPGATRWFSVDPKLWKSSMEYREMIKTAVRQRMGGKRELPHL